MKIEASTFDQISALNEIIVSAKSYWDYDPEYLAAALPLVQIDQDWLKKHRGYSLFLGELAGFMGLEVVDSKLKLEHLWIHPSKIKMGLGRFAIQEMSKVAQENNFKEVYLLPDPPAENFYLKLGAQLTGKEVQSRVVGGPLFREMLFKV